MFTTKNIEFNQWTNNNEGLTIKNRGLTIENRSLSSASDPPRGPAKLCFLWRHGERVYVNENQYRYGSWLAYLSYFSYVN